MEGAKSEAEVVAAEGSPTYPIQVTDGSLVLRFLLLESFLDASRYLFL